MILTMISWSKLWYHRQLWYHSNARFQMPSYMMSLYRAWPDIWISRYDIGYQIPDIGINIGFNIGYPNIGMFRIPILGSISGSISRAESGIPISACWECRYRVQYRVQYRVSRYRGQMTRYDNQYRVWYRVPLNPDGPGWCLALMFVITV